MSPKNELETLLLSSLEQISKESQAQRQEVSAEYTACMQTFRERCGILTEQYEQVHQHLKVLDGHYEEVMQLLQTLNDTLGISQSVPSKRSSGYTGGGQ